MSEQVQDFTGTLQEMIAEIARLHSEVDSLKNRAAVLPQPAAQSIPTGPKITSTRRKTLKRLGLAVLAGGAALGVTAATYSPVEARIVVNSPTNVGAVITRNGATLTGIPTGGKYGLIASAETSLDISTFIYPYKYGISGFAMTDNGGTDKEVPGAGVWGYADGIQSVGVWGNTSSGDGVRGYSETGTGVFGSSNAVGVLGASDTNRGVWGQSTSGYAVYGTTDSGTAIRGESSSGIGVFAFNGSTTNPALQAGNYNSAGIALSISTGGIQITGAGIGTQTAAFIHLTTAGNIISNYSIIDNQYCNGKQNALLFVTHNWNPTGINGNYDPNQFGVFYTGTRWAIFNENSSNGMSTGLYFNVLVINP